MERSSRQKSIRVMAWLAMLCVATACGEAPAPEIPTADHVFLISLDTFRRDVAGAYRGDDGGGVSITPALDGFARDAVIFEEARVQVPFTQPSHMSMFTGLYPDVHQVMGPKRRLSGQIATLPELLQAAGFATHGLAVNYWMKGSFGFERGFDDYSLHPDGKTHADQLNALAFERLDSLVGEDQRIFMFIQFFDPHSDARDVTGTAIPYYSPPEYREELGDDEAWFCDPDGHCATEFLQWSDHKERKISPRTLARIRAYYERGIRYLDDRLARFFDELESLGIYDRSLIIVTADHGEEFREHGQFLHAHTYDESVRVPLFIKLPGNAHAGKRVSGLVDSIDLLPTILEHLGLEPPEFIQGRSLLGGIEAGALDRPTSLSQDKNKKKRFALTDARYKLIYDFGGKPAHVELFDLEDDPGERHDLSQRDPERVDAMRGRLEAQLKENREIVGEIRKRMAANLQKRPPASKGSKDEEGEKGEDREKDENGENDAGDVLSKEEAEALRAIGYVDE